MSRARQSREGAAPILSALTVATLPGAGEQVEVAISPATE
jgi:hypothetical protein